MTRAKNRPRRGSPGSSVLIEGDKGIFAGPLGGAQPGATESGDLASREFGVPQADIPGGVRHLVNPQTRHARPPGVPERPADYHKEHGVEPLDDGQYETPPDETEERARRAAPEPKTDHAVPVYVVPRPDKRRRGAAPRKVIVPAAGNPPVRLFSPNDTRIGVLLLNESATIIRIGEIEIETASGGAALPVSMTNYLYIATADSLYAVADSGASSLALSVIEEFGEPGLGA